MGRSPRPRQHVDLHATLGRRVRMDHRAPVGEASMALATEVEHNLVDLTGVAGKQGQGGELQFEPDSAAPWP